MSIMMNEKEYSIVIGDNSTNNCLNETFFSHVTRGSGEKEYKELASLITKEVDEKENNVSNSSMSKILNISNSILSNVDWNGNSSRDDSKQFIDNFNVIKKNTHKPILIRPKSKSFKQKNLLYISTSFKPKGREKTLLKYNKKNKENYNYNEMDIEENNSKESNEDLNAYKIPKTDFNKNNLKELLNKDNPQYFYETSQTEENESNKLSNILISLPNQIQNKNNSKNNFNDLKEFNSNDNSFTRTFSPKNNNSSKLNNNFNQFTSYNGNSSKFPKIPEKYSDIASILKKDIKENFKKEKEKELIEIDSSVKNFSLSNAVCNNSTTIIANSNNSNLIIIPEKKQDEKKVHKLNLNDILAASCNKDENSKKNLKTSKNCSIKDSDPLEKNSDPNNSNGIKNYNTPTNNSTAKPYKICEISNKNLKSCLNGVFNSTSNNKNSSQNFSYFSMYNNNNNFGVNFSQTPQNNKNKANSAFGRDSNGNYSVSNFNSNEDSRKYSNNYNDYKHTKEEYHDFKVDLINIITGKDKRTTIMLRNIPNKYTLQNLVDEINSLFLGKYDYINLPIDYDRKLNLGYGFINFLDPLYIVAFYEHYVSKKWHKYKSDKKIDLNYAEKQGKKDVTNKDENTYFAPNKKVLPKIELPIKYLDLFKKVYPSSVCVAETKGVTLAEKTFYVKSIGNPIK